ncbi:uncharacterized protein LOC130629072 [Hydractinia symbiolongicarpus]|uniref:uncharacterized protein LOC130629072 n=1 Tax=Hydractinia symbiolongicarpus TaxID=13093 RepID=UPI00254AFC5F|nr:uncharacterized protein LOC130629072 [Hydractinia symbiolongicarpus]
MIGVIVLVIVGICIFLFFFGICIYICKRNEEYQPPALIRRFSRSLSRNASHNPDDTIEITYEPQGEGQVFLGATTVSKLSDRPPSYLDVRNSTSNFEEVLEDPPSYDEYITDSHLQANAPQVG